MLGTYTLVVAVRPLCQVLFCNYSNREDASLLYSEVLVSPRFRKPSYQCLCSKWCATEVGEESSRRCNI